MPDLYNFDVSRTVVAADIELKVGSEAIGDLISDYMFHKTDYFQLRAEYQGREKPVFSINDGMNMSRYRQLLDRSVLAFGLCLAIGVAVFAGLCAAGRRRALRNGCRVGLALCVPALGGLAELAHNDDVRDTVLRVLFNIRTQSGDVLTQLFGEGYRLEALIAVTVISAVIAIITHSIVRVFTKERRTF
jgi:hypothetical protein